MTLNELVKLTTLWTTGPRIFISKCSFLGGKIFGIFEKTCFHNGQHCSRCIPPAYLQQYNVNFRTNTVKNLGVQIEYFVWRVSFQHFFFFFFWYLPALEHRYPYFGRTKKCFPGLLFQSITDKFKIWSAMKWNIFLCKTARVFYEIQTTPLISTAFISNNRLSRTENPAPVLTRNSNNR